MMTMKKNKSLIRIAVISTFVSQVFFAPSVFAVGVTAGGTISFTGTVVGNTCTIGISGADVTGTGDTVSINMGKVNNKTINAQATGLITSLAGPRAFTIGLTDCDNEQLGTLTLATTSGSGMSGTIPVTIGGSAQGILSIAITDAETPSAVIDLSNGLSINVNGVNASHNYAAQYFANGSNANAVGEVAGSMVYTVSYQ